MASRDDKRARRERAEEMRRQRERQEKRRRNLITGVVVAVVLVVIAGAGFAVKTAVDNSADDPVRTPRGLTDDNGVTLTATDVGGTAAADPVRVTLFEDFACPHCKSFEAEAGSWLDEQVAAGAIEVEFRPVSFLTDFSRDALSAAMCVFEDGGAQAYRSYASLLFANQPTEGSNLDISDFVDLAKEADAAGAVDCIEGRPFREWAEVSGDMTRKAFETPDSEGAKLSGTPTVWVNGTTVNGPEVNGEPGVAGLADLQKAVQEAQAG